MENASKGKDKGKGKEESADKSDEHCDVCEALGAVMVTTAHPAPLSGPRAAAAAPVPVDAGTLPDAPDITVLGQASWTLLHSVAAYYPVSASAADQAHAHALLAAFAALFPCRWCARDLTALMAQRPPRVEGRAAFSQWLCETHNDVNAQLGKPRFDCARVMERWRRPGLADDE